MFALNLVAAAVNGVSKMMFGEEDQGEQWPEEPQRKYVPNPPLDWHLLKSQPVTQDQWRHCVCMERPDTFHVDKEAVALIQRCIKIDPVNITLQAGWINGRGMVRLTDPSMMTKSLFEKQNDEVIVLIINVDPGFIYDGLVLIYKNKAYYYNPCTVVYDKPDVKAFIDLQKTWVQHCFCNTWGYIFCEAPKNVFINIPMFLLYLHPYGYDFASWHQEIGRYMYSRLINDPEWADNQWLKGAVCVTSIADAFDKAVHKNVHLPHRVTPTDINLIEQQFHIRPIEVKLSWDGRVFKNYKDVGTNLMELDLKDNLHNLETSTWTDGVYPNNPVIFIIHQLSWPGLVLLWDDICYYYNPHAPQVPRRVNQQRQWISHWLCGDMWMGIESPTKDRPLVQIPCINKSIVEFLYYLKIYNFNIDKAVHLFSLEQQEDWYKNTQQVDEQQKQPENNIENIKQEQQQQHEQEQQDVKKQFLQKIASMQQEQSHNVSQPQQKEVQEAKEILKRQSIQENNNIIRTSDRHAIKEMLKREMLNGNKEGQPPSTDITIKEEEEINKFDNEGNNNKPTFTTTTEELQHEPRKSSMMNRGSVRYSVNDFARLRKLFGAPKGEDEISIDQFKTLIMDLNIDVPLVTLNTVISNFDMNKDGKIQYNEFIRLCGPELLKNPNISDRDIFMNIINPNDENISERGKCCTKTFSCMPIGFYLLYLTAIVIIMVGGYPGQIILYGVIVHVVYLLAWCFKPHYAYDSYLQPHETGMIDARRRISKYKDSIVKFQWNCTCGIKVKSGDDTKYVVKCKHSLHGTFLTNSIKTENDDMVADPQGCNFTAIELEEDIIKSPEYLLAYETWLEENDCLQNGLQCGKTDTLYLAAEPPYHKVESFIIEWVKVIRPWWTNDNLKFIFHFIGCWWCYDKKVKETFGITNEKKMKLTKVPLTQTRYFQDTKKKMQETSI